MKVYVTDDRTKPIGEWIKIYLKEVNPAFAFPFICFPKGVSRGSYYNDKEDLVTFKYAKVSEEMQCDGEW